jgi:hypothetical protein
VEPLPDMGGADGEAAGEVSSRGFIVTPGPIEGASRVTRIG